jgi:hypothetical protein
MCVGRIIKVTFYLAIAILVTKSAQIAYQKYFVSDDGQPSDSAHLFKLEFKDIKIPVSAEKVEGKSKDSNDMSYDFKNMLELIEACEKVKYLDYLRFSRPKEATQVNPDTLHALIQAMHVEKSKLKRHIAQIKASSRDSVPSKRLKSLKYYFRVVELNLQDLKGIVPHEQK